MHKNNFKIEQIDGFELTFFQKLKFIHALSNQGGLLYERCGRNKNRDCDDTCVSKRTYIPHNMNNM